MSKFYIAALAFVLPSVALSVDFVRIVNVPALDTAYSASQGALYFSAPSGAGTTYGNRIVRVDPFTGNITGTMFAGSEPVKLAMADDGVTLYAAFRGANSFRKFNAATMTGLDTYQLGNGLFAQDMAVRPGSPNQVAVSLRIFGGSPSSRDVWLYTDGVRAANHAGGDAIGFQDANTLWTYNNSLSNFGHHKSTVTSTGFQHVSTFNPYGRFNSTFKIAGNKLFSTEGEVVDLDAQILLANLGVGGALAADAETERVYFLQGSGSQTKIKIFDMNTYVPLYEIAVPGVVGGPGNLIRWGRTGLAFRTDTQFVIVNNALVPEPATLSALAIGALALLRKRRR